MKTVFDIGVNAGQDWLYIGVTDAFEEGRYTYISTTKKFVEAETILRKTDVIGDSGTKENCCTSDGSFIGDVSCDLKLFGVCEINTNLC